MRKVCAMSSHGMVFNCDSSDPKAIDDAFSQVRLHLNMWLHPIMNVALQVATVLTGQAMIEFT